MLTFIFCELYGRIVKFKNEYEMQQIIYHMLYLSLLNKPSQPNYNTNTHVCSNLYGHNPKVLNYITVKTSQTQKATMQNFNVNLLPQLNFVQLKLTTVIG